MDFNNSNQGHAPQGYPYRPPVRQAGDSLAGAALFLGAISIVTAFMMTVYFPFIFGSLAILFAILSKGRAARLAKYARAGIICGVVGLAVNVAVIVSSFVFILNNPDILTRTARQYDKMYEQIYGIDSEDVFGDSLENIVGDFIDGFNN